ncbi:MAG: hypothetical protein AB1744_09260 [Candidatus Zixiibacteriota bacterium]
MKGSLILERVNDPELRGQWQGHLEELRASLHRLQAVLQIEDERSFRMQYLEAVLQFAEARDKERNFFWDTFVEERVQQRTQTRAPA